MNGARNRWCFVAALSTLLFVGLAYARGARPRELSLHPFRNAVLVLSTNQLLDSQPVLVWGSAFVVDDRGTIVTADHVVKDLQKVLAARPGAFMTATLQQIDVDGSDADQVTLLTENENLDIAVLKFSSVPHRPHFELEPLSLDARPTIPVGEHVKLVGYPNLLPYSNKELEAFPEEAIGALVLALDLDPIVTFTQVDGVAYLMTIRGENANLQLDRKETFLVLNHPAGPGNSGGPVISSQTGKVVGMVVRTNAFGYSYAVKASDLSTVIAAAVRKP